MQVVYVSVMGVTQIECELLRGAVPESVVVMVCQLSYGNTGSVGSVRESVHASM